MLKDFIVNAGDASRNVVLRDARDGDQTDKKDSAIRINTRTTPAEIPTTEIYGRARDIFYRARRSRLSRSAGIF